MLDPMLGTREVARALGCDPSTVRALVKADAFPNHTQTYSARSAGKGHPRYKIPESDVRAYIATQRMATERAARSAA